MPAEISVCEITGMPIACSERNLSYWLRIMMEHAIFIENGLPVQREDLRTQALQFQTAFREFLARSGSIPAMNPTEVRNYMQCVRATVASFLAFKRMLIAMALKCQVGGLGGFNYPLLLDHIAREATLFLHILDMQGQGNSNPFAVALGEETFWLRIMTDHAKFIMSLLDQSERGFLMNASELSHVFDRLLRQAQDYRSMMQSEPDRFPVVSRFTDEVIKETIRIRDFKRAAHQLLLECKIIAVLPPLLADHVAREAEHFLEVLDEIRRTLPA
ncbi:MAG: DUF2935 domain-containing protein [Clostridia bacterium]|nr:DUF2935 domain-containing protein [Clostridia bacterium]